MSTVNGVALPKRFFVVEAPKLLGFLSMFAPITIGAMAIWPCIIVQDKERVTARRIRHEAIHLYQWEECLLALFLPLYLFSVGLSFLKHWNGEEAYRQSWFEREAYDNDRVVNYTETRSPYAWLFGYSD